MTHAYHTEEGARMQSARAQAYHAALAQLKDNHAAEWEKLHADEREKRGLDRKASDKHLVSKLLTQAARIKELERQLQAVNGNTEVTS